MSTPQPEAIVIGASAGAVEALSTILPMLPKGYPLPLLVVVHIPPDRKCILTELFRQKCELEVQEADDKEPVVGGTIYFAPPDYHLQVEQNKTLSLSSDEAVSFSRPSIDVLFETAADAYGEHLIGVLLTGANHDGSQGLRAIHDAGGTVLVQDPRQSLAPEMPQAAIAACPDVKVLSLSEIACYLKEAAGTLI